jgi:hypothetical protein
LVHRFGWIAFAKDKILIAKQHRLEKSDSVGKTSSLNEGTLLIAYEFSTEEMGLSKLIVYFSHETCKTGQYLLWFEAN